MAVSALGGCVTVQHSPVPGPPTASSRPSAPRPDREAETQVVQAPAQEALEMVGPDRGPESSPPPERRRAAPAAPVRQPSPRSHPQPRPQPRPDRPEPRRPAQPRVEIPDVDKDAEKGVRGSTDVCALGRKYGGWRADSPEAVICERTYGR
ncbi:Lipoprotein OS=Streptomyces aurantiogriseus OX=66870 GN=GCM10010251_49710 PE=4 SV=1 [Streptomyces aurantiogriseus]|uniref:Lipoprotein n=1 Tax=Streptomyces aurantiogriseus TaxID=66870 RepID=A0A918CJ21_9ACTN|nr:lipoprotein [Streptomyces aurantiogriseus]